MGRALGSVALRAVTCPLRMLPDFIIIGTQRGGTSAFYYHLAEHPSVAPATTKELHFFDQRLSKSTWWYRSCFPTVAQKRYSEWVHQRPLVTGESTPYYLYDPQIPQRVAATVPHVKLIALLRNPVDRAYSQHGMCVQRGWETLDFAEAIAREDERTRDGAHGDYNHIHYSYRARGHYAEQLERWLRVFPRERLLVLRSEDFYADPAAVLKQALVFLDVPAAGLPAKANYARYDNYTYRPESRGDTGMDPGLRRELSAYFAPHNARLYALLGRDMGWA